MLKRYPRAALGIRLLIIGGVAAGVGCLMDRTRTVAFVDNPSGWAYQVGVVLSLTGIAAWATAKILGVGWRTISSRQRLLSPTSRAPRRGAQDG